MSKGLVMALSFRCLLGVVSRKCRIVQNNISSCPDQRIAEKAVSTLGHACAPGIEFARLADDWIQSSIGKYFTRLIKIVNILKARFAQCGTLQ